jgi:hypothetical protein
MTLFRLSLPAGDYEGRILADCDTVRLDIPGVGTVQVPVDAVAEVPPSLPEEPPIGTVLSDGASVVIHCDEDEDPEGRWWGDGLTEFQRWSAIGPNLTIARGWRRYVPDPANGAPSLPFDIWSDGEREVIVEPSEAWIDRVFINADKAHLDVKHARQLAAALWSWSASHSDEEGSDA